MHMLNTKLYATLVIIHGEFFIHQYIAFPRKNLTGQGELISKPIYFCWKGMG